MPAGTSSTRQYSAGTSYEKLYGFLWKMSVSAAMRKMSAQQTLEVVWRLSRTCSCNLPSTVLRHSWSEAARWSRPCVTTRILACPAAQIILEITTKIYESVLSTSTIWHKWHPLSYAIYCTIYGLDRIRHGQIGTKTQHFTLVLGTNCTYFITKFNILMFKKKLK